MFLALLNTIGAAFTPSKRSRFLAELAIPKEHFYWFGEYLDTSKVGHAAAMGTTQSGKSTGLNLAMQDILPQVRTRRNTRGICYDPKGDMHAILAADRYGLGEHIVKVNPRLQGSRAWLMYRDIDTDSRAQECAELLVQKESSKEGQESYFSTAVRNLTKATMCGLMRKNAPWELRDLLLAMVNDAALESLLLPHFDTAKTYNLALEGREDTAKDVRSSINNLFNRFSTVAAMWDVAARERTGFSIGEWEAENQILVLPGASGEGDPLQEITQVLFDQIAIRILRGPEARHVAPDRPRIFLFLDELRLTGYLRQLNRMLFLSASKGVRIFVGAQGIEGLRAVFGNEEASELMSLFAIKAFLATYGSETAEWMSKQTHSQLIKEIEISVNSGLETETQTKTIRRVERAMVESMRYLRLNTPEHGDLEGFFIAPELRKKRREVYWNRIPAEKLFDPKHGLMWQPGSLDELAERDAAQQILRPWDAADLECLKLPTKVLAEQGQQLRFTSISRDMFR